MSNKMCGECKYFDAVGQCDKVIEYNLVHPGDEACEFFEPAITNGDVIRQMSNEDLADRFGIHAMCDFCLAESSDCGRGKNEIKYCREAWLAWLDAPAESEGEDE